jgi:hypothetical protein
LGSFTHAEQPARLALVPARCPVRGSLLDGSTFLLVESLSSIDSADVSATPLFADVAYGLI